MSHFLDRLTFFRQKREPFSNGHGVLTNEDRKWENAYRSRWSHDKVARSTHGVNCPTSPAAARAGRLTAGMFTLPSASNTR